MHRCVVKCKHCKTFTDVCELLMANYEQFYIVCPFNTSFLLIKSMFDLVYPKALINTLINLHVLTCS